MESFGLPAPMKRHVKLWALSDVVLIILEESGVVYENQVMGNLCMQASAEGVLVPLSPDYPIDSRGKVAVDTLAERLGWAILNDSRVDEKKAAVLDAILREYPECRGIHVDRVKLNDSCEAWVYVTVEPTRFSPMVDFGSCRGILTWLNSD